MPLINLVRAKAENGLKEPARMATDSQRLRTKRSNPSPTQWLLLAQSRRSAGRSG